MLRLGAGNDRGYGGTGNDIIEASEGQNQAWGGAGTDLFIFDTAKTGKTILRDFSAADLILFGSFASSAGGDPNVDSLDDIPPGTIENFAFKETNAGHLKLEVGDQVVILRNTQAADVLLDQLYFGASTADDLVAGFNLGAANLGDSLHGATLSKGTAGGTNFIAFGSETSTFDVFGFSSSEFIAYGSETST
jgi:Ca2+-binding RTX toxin-like protein